MLVDDLPVSVVNETDVEDVPIEQADDADERDDNTEYRITSFGIDYDVDGIVRRLEKRTIELPEFQRSYVWSIRRASKFIESLLLKLPVPGIFLYREHGSHIQMVIDGRQRLETLRRYYEGKFDSREFALIGVRKKFLGLKYQDLTDEMRGNLDDTIIHATIIKQDEPNDGGSSQFEIFQRLNTNATPLSAQEIRAASFRGKFCDLLVELNENENWRELFGNVHRRRRDEELILRFFAFYYDFDDYERPIKGFMNDFMDSNSNLEKYSREQLKQLFESTTSNVLEKIGSRAFRPTRAFNAALFDAVMVGVGRRLEKGEIRDKMKSEFHKLLERDEFKTAIGYRTSDVDRVNTRIRMASEAFDTVR